MQLQLTALPQIFFPDDTPIHVYGTYMYIHVHVHVCTTFENRLSQFMQQKGYCNSLAVHLHVHVMYLSVVTLHALPFTFSGYVRC